MSNVVHLKWGEQPTSEHPYLMVRRLGRVRGDDYFVAPCAALQDAAKSASESRAFASLTSALREAETVAASCGAEIIYVRMNG
jgi:hypothetical protein